LCNTQAKLQLITFNKVTKSPDGTSKITVKSSLKKKKKSETGDSTKMKMSEQYIMNNYQSNQHINSATITNPNQFSQTPHTKSIPGAVKYHDKKNLTELSYQQKILWQHLLMLK
jgi:hypothetical protein